ncbi:cysteinyl leukotriene receptor 1 [Cottoperca gobio]|uniref:Cysteinyl leukotriene receptor 1 n=1 Tax=Cottoperca gobio TaxID=56716 RepID=A0A6J2QK94_COTGO|nr:cysteinyl leukotriene receptor 1 [Cottoperca gobio]
MESNLSDSLESNSTNCPGIDDFRSQVFPTAYSLITVLGLVGNGLVLVVLIRTYRKSSPFHVYMLNLAVSDLLCVLTLPLRVLYYANKGEWKQGDFLCRFSSFAFYVNLYCSIYFMVAMSITRFLAIVFPVQNMRLVTENRSRLVCVGIWVFICLLSSPFLMSGQHVDRVTNKFKCFETPKDGDKQKLIVLNYLSVVVGFILPFLVILICYAGIVRALLSRTQAAQRQHDMSTRVIRMIVIVLLTFLISFMPYHVQRTIHLSFKSGTKTDCPDLATQKTVVVTQCLAAANSCFDPLLYFFSGEGFRSRLSSLQRSMKSNTLNRIARMKTTTGPVVGENLQLKAS